MITQICIYKKNQWTLERINDHQNKLNDRQTCIHQPLQFVSPTKREMSTRKTTWSPDLFPIYQTNERTLQRAMNTLVENQNLPGQTRSPYSLTAHDRPLITWSRVQMHQREPNAIGTRSDNIQITDWPNSGEPEWCATHK